MTACGQHYVVVRTCVTVLTSAHLLRDHNDERRQGSTADSRDGEKLDAALEVV